MLLNTDTYRIDFWKSVYIASIKSGDDIHDAKQKADSALMQFEEKFYTPKKQ